MACSSALPRDRSCVRSVSLPARLHPIAGKIEEVLYKTKTWETSSTSTSANPTAKTVEVGVLGLSELYKCVQDFVDLPLTRQVLVHNRQATAVEDVLNESVCLLDVCGTAKDALLTMKRGLQNLQSSLRRKRNAGPTVENHIRAYMFLKKDIKKDIVKCLAVLKKLNEKNELAILNQNHHLAVVIRVLREVSSITISIFQNLLSFLSATDFKRKPGGWSLLAKVIKSKADNLHGSVNEVESVDIALHALCRYNSSLAAQLEKVQVAQERLKALEESMGGLEGCVNSLYRCLVQTRVSLLNALNH